MTEVYTFTLDRHVVATKTNIQGRDSTYQGRSYTLLNYEKGYVCFDDMVARPYRSVVFQHPTGRLCCVSPPKSVPIDHFATGRGDVLDPWVSVSEIIEGTMINLWYDHEAGCWEISSKTAVGADHTYFRYHLSDGAEACPLEDDGGFVGTRTFREMFVEATGGMGCCAYYEWPRNCCYSFVLQHPENQLVLEVTEPRLYLVAVYMMDMVGGKGGSHEATAVPLDVFRKWTWFTEQPWVHFPEEYPASRLSALMAQARSLQGSPNRVGVMLTDTRTGVRTKIVHRPYLETKELRAANPNILYPYLALRYVGLVDDYLTHFPWYRVAFDRYATLVDQLAENLLVSYKTRYVERTGEVISHRFMPHIYTLHHGVYLATKMVTGTGTVVTREVIDDYLGRMTPTELYMVLMGVRVPVGVGVGVGAGLGGGTGWSEESGKPHKNISSVVV